MMDSTETMAAPIVEMNLPTSGAWQRERTAYFKLLPGLLATHSGRYVAIYGGELVDHDEYESPLVDRVYAKHGYVPIYVGLVGIEEQPVRIPFRREISVSPDR